MILLGGLRMPLGGDVYALTVEGRYQWGSGDTGGAANEFLGDKIDLGGGSLEFRIPHPLLTESVDSRVLRVARRPQSVIMDAHFHPTPPPLPRR